MSEQPVSEWWQASDGQWYPPDGRPDGPVRIAWEWVIALTIIAVIVGGGVLGLAVWSLKDF